MHVCPFCRIALLDPESPCPRDGHAGQAQVVEPVPAAVAAQVGPMASFGRGDTGTLYLADRREGSGQVLLKIVRFPGGAYAADRKRMYRELNRQLKLAHPTLATLRHVGVQENTLWLLRDWVEGESLRVRLRRSGPLPVSEVLAITAQVAAGLDELHRAGLLHRDLKPGHIVLQDEASGLPRVRLIDAGIAAGIETGGVFALNGTAAYVSPEQIAGKLINFRSDLYALGCLMFEMLAGRPPYEGSVSEVLAAHREGDVPTLPWPLPTSEPLPAEVERLLMSLLSKDPRERPFSSQHVRRSLEPWVPAGTPLDPLSTKGVAGVAADPHRAETVIAPMPTAPVARHEPAPPSTTGPPKETSGPRPSVPPPLPPDACSTEGRVSQRPPPAPQLRSVPPPIPGAARAAGDDMTLMLSDEDLVEASEGSASDAAVPTVDDATHMLAPEDILEALDTEALEEMEAPDEPEDATVQFERLDSATYHADPEVPEPYEAPEVPEPYEAAPEELEPYEAAAADPHEVPASIDPEALREAADAWDAEAVVEPDPALLEQRRRRSRTGLAAAAVLLLAFGVFALSGSDEEAAEPVTELAGGKMRVLSGGTDEEASPPPKAEDVTVPARDEAVDDAKASAIRENTPSEDGSGQDRSGQDGAAQDDGSEAVAQVAASGRKVEPDASEERARRTRSRATAPRSRATVARSVDRGDAMRSTGRKSRLEQADELRERARGHYQARRYREAARDYQRATRLAPSHAGGFAGLGASLLAIGDAKGAIGAYQRAAQLSPESSGFHAALGRAYYTVGDKQRAAAAYRKAVALDPKNGVAQQALSRLSNG